MPGLPQAGARLGALQLGGGTGRVGLGLLQVLAGGDAGFEEFTLARQGALGQRRVGTGLGRVGLGRTEIGRCELGQRRTGLHRLANIDQDALDPAGEGGVLCNFARITVPVRVQITV